MKNITGVFLAGGENTRFPATKSFIRIDGERVVERSLGLLRGCFEEVLISTNSPELYFYTMAPLIGDIINTRGPISGILSCLLNSRHEHIFVMACDMPFVKRGVIELIVSKMSQYDAIVPLIQSETQPLLAVYGRSVIPAIEEHIQRKEKSLRRLLDEINVYYVAEEDIRRVDRELESFININTLEDLNNIDIECTIEV